MGMALPTVNNLYCPPIARNHCP